MKCNTEMKNKRPGREWERKWGIATVKQKNIKQQERYIGSNDDDNNSNNK